MKFLKLSDHDSIWHDAGSLVAVGRFWKIRPNKYAPCSDILRVSTRPPKKEAPKTLAIPVCSLLSSSSSSSSSPHVLLPHRHASAGAIDLDLIKKCLTSGLPLPLPLLEPRKYPPRPQQPHSVVNFLDVPAGYYAEIKIKAASCASVSDNCARREIKNRVNARPRVMRAPSPRRKRRDTPDECKSHVTVILGRDRVLNAYSRTHLFYSKSCIP